MRLSSAAKGIIISIEMVNKTLNNQIVALSG